MIIQRRLALIEVEQRVCDLASERLAISMALVSPTSRLIEDLNCDSLDLLELFMDLEEKFGVTLPNQAPNPVYKAVFTRQPFRLSDLAELVYLQQGSGTPDRNHWRESRTVPPPTPSVPFTQLGGILRNGLSAPRMLEPVATEGMVQQFRRRSDGMRCLLLPATSIEIGSESPDSLPDEQPIHVARLDAFLIDAEPVSTTAYCRFLNSIGKVCPDVLADWFLLALNDDRREHMVIAQVSDQWQPIACAERWPMILVSWYGANAYSLWANGRDWTSYRGESASQSGSFLPSEAQWEYAARGPRCQSFPWGEAPPSLDLMRFGQHRRSATYRADTLPIANVNERLGISPFGLHHMAGNVWQWCRDWYDVGFYHRPEAVATNPVNRQPGKVRSERGGSWIGPAELCRCSFRRGRPPAARGRCLGFRCISSPETIA